MSQPYTPSKCELDRHHIIAHALLHGKVTHQDAEKFDPPCTVIRSRIPEIWKDLGWPIKNIMPPTTQAIYWINQEELAQRAGVTVDGLKRAAWDWCQQGKTFGPIFPFLEFLKGYRCKNPAADPKARLIFKAAKKVLRSEYQGEFWAY